MQLNIYICLIVFSLVLVLTGVICLYANFVILTYIFFFLGSFIMIMIFLGVLVWAWCCIGLNKNHSQIIPIDNNMNPINAQRILNNEIGIFIFVDDDLMDDKNFQILSANKELNLTKEECPMSNMFE